MTAHKSIRVKPELYLCVNWNAVTVSTNMFCEIHFITQDGYGSIEKVLDMSLLDKDIFSIDSILVVSHHC